MTKSRPVLIVFSILAGAQVLTAGSALADIIGAKPAALVVIVIAAIQAGMTFYVQGVVTPARDVAAYVDENGKTVAGPASSPPDGTAVIVVRE